MNTNAKRFIAREILIFFGAVILCSIIVLVVYYRNEHRISQLSSPEKIGFQDLVEEDIRVKYLQGNEFDFSDIVEDPREHHINKLHELLKESNYTFLRNEYAADFQLFRRIIVNELNGQFDQENLKNIYEFLKSRQFLLADFDTFQASLLASMTSTQRGTMLREKTLSSGELADTVSWICILILVIVYPFRFLVLLLIWAVRTLKTNE